MTHLDDMIQALDGARIADLRYELTNLRAVRAWAISQLDLDYEPGDRVAIVSDRPSLVGRGWAAYSEALAVGQTGIAGEITFNEHPGRWSVLVGMDRSWSTSDGGRHWKGPADETPDGYIPPSDYDRRTWPEGRVKHFARDVSWIKKVREGS